MQVWRTAVVLVAAVLLQVALGRLLGPTVSLPFDLFLILAVFYAGSTSPFGATILGTAIGLIGDALSPHVLIGRQAFALTATAYGAARVNGLFVILAGPMKLVVVFCATFLARGIIHGVDLLLDGGVFVVRDVAIEATVNAILAPLIMRPLERWHGLREQPRLVR